MCQQGKPSSFSARQACMSHFYLEERQIAQTQIQIKSVQIQILQIQITGNQGGGYLKPN